MNRFGVSTHLYRSERLALAQLSDIASHGFDAIELFAARPHFDHQDPRAIEALAGWLRASRLDMPSVHAPLADAAAVLEIARQIPFRFLVVHAPLDAGRPAALRSLEELHHAAQSLGVRLALEVMAGGTSSADALVDLIEGELDGLDFGICMDVGHAFMTGDTADAIDSASGYLVTTHLHDNRRRHDDHLVPFEGGIDWASTMMAFEKIGYDGVLMFEARSQGSPHGVLERAARARKRLEELSGTPIHPYL